MTTALLPKRPYLFNAFYNWILDNNLTPYIVVKTDVKGVNVPEQFVQDDRIVLNISPASVSEFSNDNRTISFSATFSGNYHLIKVPFRALEALYARENSQGISFEDEPYYHLQSEEPTTKSSPFKVIK